MPIIDMIETGNNIKILANKTGITIKEIAEKLGFASAYPVYKWINGKNMPAIDNLIMLAAIFGTTIDKIIITETI